MRKYIRAYAMILLTSLILVSCSLSTNELAEEVKSSMRETTQFKENSIQINSLILTKKSGNEYSGILETSEPNGEFTYSVEVIYDGENMNWKVVE